MQRAGQIISFDLEFARDFAAFPIRLAAVAHQEFQGGLAGQERVVLFEVPDLQSWMTDDFTRIEFIITEDASQQCRLASTVASDEADLGIGRQRAFRSIEQDLVAVAFVCVADLEQDGHGVEFRER